MSGIYVDTAYHVAIIDPFDSYRAVALAKGKELHTAGARLVTSEAALIEFLTYLSGHDPRIRAAAVVYVRELVTDPRVTVIPQTQDLFDRALNLYERRPDKTYSMVDTIGMVICVDGGISEVLTADHDFEQEGLTILLK